MTATQTPRTRRAKGRAREAIIVQAAAELMVERGLANVRVADVAARAGIGPGHVTYYFPSKEELVVQAIRLSEEQLATEVADVVQDIEEPWARLDEVIALSAASGPADPGWILWFHLWSSAARDPRVAAVHDELDAGWRSLLTEVITYGCDRGSFATTDAGQAARLLSATIDGLSIQLALGSSELTRDELVRLCRRQAELLLRPT